MSDRNPSSEIAELRQRLEQQRRLIEASHALHTSLDLREVLGLILSEATEGVGVERGTVFLFTEDGSELWSEVVAGSEYVEIRLPVGQGIAGHVAATGETIRIDDAYADARFDPSWDERSGFRTRNILCAPVRGRRGEIVGVFQLLNKRTGRFSSTDEEFLGGLSIHAALALENARLHSAALERERQAREIDLALEVQRRLQPEQRELAIGRFVAAGRNEVCEDASGDYYDLITGLPGGRICIVVGDVSGHGLQAALVMAEVRALLRALVATTENVARVVELLNAHLVPDLDDGKFVSLFVALIDPRNGRVEWCNAGHCPPLHLRASNRELRHLSRTGVILGIDADLSYAAGESFVLEPGDLLLCYTDGVTEARDQRGRFFGEERLCEEVMQRPGASPRALLDSLREEVERWTHGSPNGDDLTMLALRHVPRPGAS